MLLRLKITNYALIAESEINFGTGMSVITGETGAGKSILLGALALLLGSRADSSIIKQGEKKCIVEADFDITNYNLQEFFDQNDLDYCPTTNIRREIADSGKSRAFVNDTPVNLNTLKDLGTLLTDIHSQHQTLEIGHEDFQIKLMDVVAKNEDILKEYKNLYHQYSKTKAELEKLKKEAEKNAKESEFLHYRFDELDNAKLKENEQTELEEELDALSHNEDIKNALSTACEKLSRTEDNNILLNLKETVSSLKKIENFYPKISELANRLEQSYIEIDDIYRELDNLDENTEFSPQRLETVSNRLGEIYALEKKYNAANMLELITMHTELKEKLATIDNYEENTAELEKQLQETTLHLNKKSQELTQSRKNAIENLKTQTSELLIQLGMPNAKLDAQFTTLNDFTPIGKDSVKFMFSANKNVALQDLSRTASGGELSRLMLCIKYILSNSVKLPTIIFDEIDTGISGDIAGKMGNMFARMAQNMQVICITHLPQVASKGKHHFKVYKHEVNETIKSDIKELSSDERITEIAGMLSGETITEAALQNAKDLLKNA